MSHPVLFDLEHNRKRLEYYTLLKARTPKAPALGKWIEIYAERVRLLERQVNKLGLRTELPKASAARASSARH
jgi:hypothetical protein